MEQSIVYVLEASGKPLMPARRRNKVWYWLRRGSAKVVSREPFTIQLRFETTAYTQPVTAGVDTGSKTVGMAATTNGAVVYQTEVLKTAVVQHLRAIFGTDQVAVSCGYETKYQRVQLFGLPKSHINDAVAIACAMGEVVKPCTVAHQLHCVPCGSYQLFNGKHSEHRVPTPRRVKGWKLYERVGAKGQVGYIGGRRLKGSFALKDLSTGKAILEVAPSKLQHLARCTHGWIASTMEFNEKEGGASFPV